MGQNVDNGGAQSYSEWLGYNHGRWGKMPTGGTIWSSCLGSCSWDEDVKLHCIDWDNSSCLLCNWHLSPVRRHLHCPLRLTEVFPGTCHLRSLSWKLFITFISYLSAMLELKVVYTGGSAGLPSKHWLVSVQWLLRVPSEHCVGSGQGRAGASACKAIYL